MAYYGPCRKCGHTINHHTDGMKCKTCNQECGIYRPETKDRKSTDGHGDNLHRDDSSSIPDIEGDTVAGSAAQ